MAEDIHVTFLGTGSAIPTARRNHPAVLLRFASESLLFDCGEGTQRQFRRARLNPCKLTRVFISHWHGDHTLGLPGLFQTLSINGYHGTLQVYGPKGTKAKIQQILDVFMKWYFSHGMTFTLEVHDVGSGVVVDEKDFCVEAVALNHGIPDLAYSFVVKEKSRLDKKKLKKLSVPNGPQIKDLSLGKTVTINGRKVVGKKLLYVEPSRKVTLITDTRMCDGAVKAAKNADLVVCESTFSSDEGPQVASDHGHLTSKQAATIAKKAKAKKLALVHTSQRYEAVPKKLLSEAKAVFSEVFLPEDLDSLVL